MQIENWLYHNYDVVPQRDGTELTICCPFCQDDSYHLSVSMLKPVWQCWRCHRTGKHVKLVMCAENISYTKALKLLKNPKTVKDFDKMKKIWFDEVAGYTPEIHEQTKNVLISKPSKPFDMPDWFTPLLPISKEGIPTLQYLRKRLEMNSFGNRMFTDTLILKYHFGYLKKKDITEQNKKFYGRLLMPIETGYFQARTVNKKHPAKYLNPDLPVADRVFNYMALLEHEWINIAEGVFDAIAIGDNTIGVLGSSISVEQARRIVKSGVKHITLCPDAGYQFSVGTVKAANHFESYGIDVDIRHYERADPAECNEFDTHAYDFKYKLLARLGG